MLYFPIIVAEIIENNSILKNAYNKHLENFLNQLRDIRVNEWHKLILYGLYTLDSRTILRIITCSLFCNRTLCLFTILI